MTCTRILLGILSVAVLATPALAAQAPPNCEEWNTREFFETATVEDVTACLASGADVMARDDRVEAGQLGSGDTVRSNGAYQDGYSYVGRAGQEVAVEVRSSDFNTYLIVESPSGERFVGERFVNDDYQGDTWRSLLSLSLDETGEYRFLVSSYSSGESDPYTLRIGQGGTPLHQAARNNENPAVLGVLLAAGADPNAPMEDGTTPLHWAARNDENPAVIEALLAAGADPNVVARFFGTPLHWAAGNHENPAAIEVLLAAGADPMARDDDGGTPLHWAAGNHENPAAIEVLLAAGADATARDDTGTTPLHAAAWNGYPAVITALLAAGADVDARITSDPLAGGTTPLHAAARNNGNPVVIEALLAAGANLEARDEDGNTPLHQAAANTENPAIIEALLDAGADPHARNAAGNTPWDLAEANEPLQGTDGYWRLNDARFEPPGPDARRAPPSREGAEAASSGADSTEGEGSEDSPLMEVRVLPALPLLAPRASRLAEDRARFLVFRIRAI